MKEEEKANVDSKEQEEHSLMKNKHRVLNRSQKKIVLGGKKGSSKGEKRFS